MKISVLGKLIPMNELVNSSAIMDNPTGDSKVAIFDIDHCLYASKEFKDYETKLKKSDFIEKEKLLLEGKVKDPANEAKRLVEENTKNGRTFMELYCSELGMTPLEYYRKYEATFKYEQFIKRDKQLIDLISRLRLSYRLFAMTNSSNVRASKILNILGLSDYFEKTFCAIIVDQENGSESASSNPFEHVGLDSPDTETISSSSDAPDRTGEHKLAMKPDPKVYGAVYHFIGANDPSNIVFFDDSRANVEASLKAGWKGIIIEQYKDNSTENKLMPELEKLLSQ